MSQSIRHQKITHHKSHTNSPDLSALRPIQTHQYQPLPDSFNFKKQVFSKLNFDKCFPFKLDSLQNKENKSTQLLTHRRRTNTDMIAKKKFCLPQLSLSKKQAQFKSQFRQLKLQSKRMLDRVNQLFEIIKPTQPVKSVRRFRGRTLSKAQNQNPEQGQITLRTRNRTLASKELTLIQQSAVDGRTKKPQIGNQRYSERYSERQSTQESPSGLMFTFYPKVSEINQFMI